MKNEVGSGPGGISCVDVELFAWWWIFRFPEARPPPLPLPTSLAVDQMNISGTLETELITIVLRTPSPSSSTSLSTIADKTQIRARPSTHIHTHWLLRKQLKFILGNWFVRPVKSSGNTKVSFSECARNRMSEQKPIFLDIGQLSNSAWTSNGLEANSKRFIRDFYGIFYHFHARQTAPSTKQYFLTRKCLYFIWRIKSYES